MTWTLHHGDWRKMPLPKLKPGQRCCVVSDPPYSDRVHIGRRTGSSVGAYSNKSKKSHAGSGAVSEITYPPLTKALVRQAVARFLQMKPEWWCLFSDHVTAAWWETALKKAGQYTFAPVPWCKTDAPARQAGEGPDSDTEWIVAADGAGLDSSMLRRIAQEIDAGFIPENDRILIARHMKRIRRYGNREGYYLEPTASTRIRGGDKFQGEKPLTLMRKVLRHYVEPGDLVIDFCAGKGTTLLSAVEYGCDAWGCEIDESTYKAARLRLTDFDKQPVLPGTVSIKPRQLALEVGDG